MLKFNKNFYWQSKNEEGKNTLNYTSSNQKEQPKPSY